VAITFIPTLIGKLLMRNDISKKEKPSSHPPFLFASISFTFICLFSQTNKKQMVREIKTDIKKQKKMLPKHYNSYIKLREYAHAQKYTSSDPKKVALLFENLQCHN